MFNFVVDMMGNDNGPNALIEAVKKYSCEHKDVHFICVGQEDKLLSLKSFANVEIVNAPDVIKMDDDPFRAIKAKESSMMKGFYLLKEHKYDAIISCGGTGAYLTGATLILGRIPGVIRPCFVAPFPTLVKGKYTVLLDVGANNKNTIEEMVQFAHIGAIYSSVVFNAENPKVFLLSNGTEDHKGSPLVSETNAFLRQSNWSLFCGNIEARDVLSGSADVVVCDGFSGNILLKSVEGTFSAVKGLLKSGFKKNIFTMIGYLFSKSVVNNISTTFDYKTVGGAMLLGVNSIVVKAHGNSDELSMLGAFNVAYKLVNNKITEKIENEIKDKE